MKAEPLAKYRVRAKLWRYAGAGGWHFVNLSERDSYEIRERFSVDRPGWGAVPIRAMIGKTQWKTSIFWDRKSETFLFAIKAEVRRAEGIKAGDTITARVAIVPRKPRKRVP